jgi:hypothetical protein
MKMHSLETLRRINAEWPHPKSRREAAIQHLEDRLGVVIDRSDPMIGAMALMEMSMVAKFNQY